ncbi:MAG: hypothetical protein ABI036_10880 [Fibrobacteria bacterium]
MKLSKLTLSLHTLAFTGAASLLFTGCVTNQEEGSYTSDGSGAYMASEVDQMGLVYGQISSDAPAAKTSALGLGSEFTITGELVVEPFAYHEDCACFVRHATFTGIKGYERDRVDSVTLIDSSGTTMNVFKKNQVAKIIHKRNVVKTKGAKEADIRFDITVDIKTDAGVKKGVWNGTMTGTYNGQALKSGSMDKVTRVWADGRFGFPESGTITLERPVLNFVAEFLGDNKMKVTITNKVTKKIHIFWVDKDYNETDPLEQP